MRWCRAIEQPPDATDAISPSFRGMVRPLQSTPGSSMNPSEIKPPAASQPTDDPVLVGRIAAGDVAALSELYDRYAGLLLALGRRVLNDASDAEDVLQEVFLQVWNQASRYERSRSSVSTWLTLITRSRAIDRLRTRQVVDRTVNTLQQQNLSTHTSPEGMGSVLNLQRRKRLRQELQELPLEQAQVLELAFYQGMTQSEIAQAMNIPLGTVKTRALLAMKKLRKALEAEISELL